MSLIPLQLRLSYVGGTVTPLEFSNWLTDPHRRPLVMGVLNLTPDSFSDGGAFSDSGAAVAHAEQMASDGAAIIDIGAESTRPGSQPVAAEEQIARLIPVVRAVRARVPQTILSIDTTQAAVAEAALDVGAHLINDISAGRDDPAMLPMVARRAVPIILMHMQGTPATMQVNPTYTNVTKEVRDFLENRIAIAKSAGIDPTRILIDPGIGFGKTLLHNLELLRNLREFASLGNRIVLGTSRKGFIGKISGEDLASRRLFGTAATVAWGVANHASILRVHDVGPMSQVVRMIEAIQTTEAPDIPQTP